LAGVVDRVEVDTLAVEGRTDRVGLAAVASLLSGNVVVAVDSMCLVAAVVDRVDCLDMVVVVAMSHFLVVVA
jgi:hypothetical protein